MWSSLVPYKISKNHFKPLFATQKRPNTFSSTQANIDSIKENPTTQTVVDTGIVNKYVTVHAVCVYTDDVYHIKDISDIQDIYFLTPVLADTQTVSRPLYKVHCISVALVLETTCLIIVLNVRINILKTKLALYTDYFRSLFFFFFFE